MGEYRRIGPPGTGKTTWLAQQIGRAVRAWCERTGRSPEHCDDVLVTSLTRAASKELISREVEIGENQIGTLHSHCRRALNVGEKDGFRLCVNARGIRPWNTLCEDRGWHSWKLTPEESGGSRGRDGESLEDDGSNTGNVLREQYKLYRSLLTPTDAWVPEVLAFAEEYQAWKRSSQVYDFSDLIHEAIEWCPAAPGRPSVIFVDEAQDCDPAELKLLRQWGASADKLIIVGDPQQAIYEFRGAVPEAFFSVDLPDGHESILEQSYRCPRAVYEAAQGMIRRATDVRHYEWTPRDEDGVVTNSDNAFSCRFGAGFIVDEVLGHVEAGRSVMLLAACDYMLGKLCKSLKSQGVPYWNPFSPDRGSFNPVRLSRGKSACQKVLSFLAPAPTWDKGDMRLWNATELKDWFSLIDSGKTLVRGAKSKVDAWVDEEYKPGIYEVAGLFHNGVLDWLTRQPVVSPWWLHERANAKKAQGVEYACRVHDRCGVGGFTRDPSIVVGTIHSVKGGEADVVYLSPELSPKGFDCLNDDKLSGRVYRQFYVGMTRARQTLVLCGSNSSMRVDW